MVIKQSLEAFSEVVETIYDSALDAALWPAALEKTSGYVGGCQANLFYQSVDKRSVSVFHSWGDDDYYRQLYIDKYVQLNPLFPASSFLEVGAVYAVNDIIPFAEFRETQMYREWVQPQRIMDALYTNLERSATGAAALAVRRYERDGFFDDDARVRFGLIVPHVRRAVTIGNVLGFHKANAAALSTTLDGLDSAVFLVAADGRLVHVNESGAALLTAADVLRSPQGRVTAADPRADRELSEAIAAAARGDADLGVKGVAIPLAADDKATQLVHVLSLASGARRDILHGPAVAALFVRKSVFHTPAPLEIVTQLYGLTASEVRVLAMITEGSGVKPMARRLGLADGTVKSHLKRLFTKTGTRRQADLVRLLADHSSPLRA